MTVLRSGSASDVGRVRSINQDLALEEPNLFAVADGMGGHVGGEVAARVAIDALRASFARDTSLDGLHQAFATANGAVFQQSREQSGLRGMGTTLTALALAAGQDGRDVMALANVGDSRAYLYSQGQLTQVTADHSLAEEKVRHGELTEAEAAVHPHRHILTRALGVADDVEIDLWELHLRSGDRLLLCSDGLTNEVGPDELAQVLGSVKDPKQAARRLVVAANEHGGHDNITVLVVDVLVGEPGSEPAIEPVSTAVQAGGEAAGPDATAASGGVAGAATTAAPPAAAPGDATQGPGDGTQGTHDESPVPDDTEEPARAGTATAVPPSEPPGDAGTGAQTHDAATPLAATGGGSALTAPGKTVRQAGAAAPQTGDSDLTGVTPAVRGRTRPPTAAAPTGMVAAAGAATAAGPVASAGTTPRRQWEPPPPETDEERKARLKAERKGRRGRRGLPRRVTLRVVVFFVLLAAVVVAAYGIVRWYATQNWYVTVDGNHLVVYQGRPGGVLGFHPQLVDRSDVTTSQILAIHLDDLKNDVEEPSLAQARAYIANLKNEYTAQQLLDLPPTTLAPPPTTTTTAPPTTTTTVPGTPANPFGTPTTAPATAPPPSRR